MGQAMGRPARLIPVPVSWLKLAAAMVGKQDVAQRLCGSLQVDIEKTRRLLGWSLGVASIVRFSTTYSVFAVLGTIHWGVQRCDCADRASWHR